MGVAVAILIVGFGILLLGGVVAVLVWKVKHGMKARQAAAELARQLGWQIVMPVPDVLKVWYGGVAQGRRVALRMAPLRVGQTAEAGPRNQLFLRMVMEVVLREDFEGSAMRGLSDRRPLVSFEESLQVQNPQRFGPEAREAIRRFVAEGYPTGIQGTAFRTGPGTRNVWVADRRKAPEDFLPTVVLQGAKAFVQHDHPNADISVEDFQNLLYQMAQIAYAIEQGR
jgi:hypothetical protein